MNTVFQKTMRIDSGLLITSRIVLHEVSSVRSGIRIILFAEAKATHDSIF